MIKEVNEICTLNIELYKCISKNIATDRVVLTNKSIVHIEESHPDAYADVVNELKDTIISPDYIIADNKRADTGLIVRKIVGDRNSPEHTFVVLRICTDSKNGTRANSIISGWKISGKRLNSYLKNREILYKK